MRVCFLTLHHETGSSALWYLTATQQGLRTCTVQVREWQWT